MFFQTEQEVKNALNAFSSYSLCLVLSDAHHTLTRTSYAGTVQKQFHFRFKFFARLLRGRCDILDSGI